MPEINFFWDPVSDNILQERDETGAVTAEYTAEPGLYGNVISQNRDGVESQFHYDAQGSTLAVTDDNQNVTDTFAYTAFGEVTERTGTAEVPFQYIGQKGYYTDGTTGQIMARRRPYEPARARWLTVDPVWAFITREAYLYVGNRPLNRLDPSGLLCANTLTNDGCLDCVNDLMKNDTQIKVLIEILTEWNKRNKPKCFVESIYCGADASEKKCQVCKDRPRVLGELLSSEFDRSGTSYIVLCSYKFYDLSGSEIFPQHGKCGHLAETYRQEMIHYVDRCRRKQGKVDVDNCSACLCDELRGHWYSGQCKPGAVWYETGGGSGRRYTSEGECLIASAMAACDFACVFAIVKEDVRRAKILETAKKCALYKDLGEDFPPPLGAPRDE